MTREELASLTKGLSATEMQNILQLIEEIEQRKLTKMCRDSLPAFVLAMQEDYKMGAHLKRLYALLEDIESGEKDRILVNMAPRFGKSNAISILFPAWYLGRNPTHKLIIASHTADLAVDMLRKVRNLMATDQFKTIFPGVEIASDAKAAGKWNTNKGGEAYAVGVGGALAGRGAHLLVVDDPFSEQDVISGNYEVFDKVYEWYAYGARTRLMPGGRVAILHCLVGSTQVMLEDGSSKALRDIRPGDMVASYDQGSIRPAKVLNWANQGLDRIFTIALKSGNMIRGNERHPFLVHKDGVESWVKIKDLKPGMLLVSTRGARTPREASENPGFVEHAKSRLSQKRKLLAGYHHKNAIIHVLQKVARTSPLRNLGRGIAALAKPASRIIEKTLMHPITPLGTTVNGKENFAQSTHAANLLTLGASVRPVRTKTALPDEKLKVIWFTTRPNGDNPTSKPDTVLTKSSTWLCTPLNKASARSVTKNLMRVIHQKVGQSISSLWTTAIRLVKLERSSVTHAISLSKIETASNCCSEPLSTLSITLDEILSITLDVEQEDVFDIQVEGTENFLANGVVSHNTRWSLRDLTARLLKDAKLNPESDQFELFEFPAVLNEGTDKEKSLWPEQWTLEALKKTKASMPLFQWNAQYQQNPTNADSGIVQKGWFMQWERENPPNCEYIIMALDAAVESNKRSDFNALTTWGVFMNEESNRHEIILLNSLNFRAEFPELKDKAKEEYDYWEPDSFIIEAKANGAPLLQEFRKAGVYVQSFVPHRGTGDKSMRLNSVADMIRDGIVWVPQTRWAEELVEQVSAFPGGEKDDLVDSMYIALARFRQGGFVRLSTDEQDDDDSEFQSPRRRYY